MKTAKTDPPHYAGHPPSTGLTTIACLGPVLYFLETEAWSNENKRVLPGIRGTSIGTSYLVHPPLKLLGLCRNSSPYCRGSWVSKRCRSAGQRAKEPPVDNASSEASDVSETEVPCRCPLVLFDRQLRKCITRMPSLWLELSRLYP